MLAAEQAVHAITYWLQILKTQSVSSETIEEYTAHLHIFQCELSVATEELLKAEKDIGVVYLLLRKRGLPLVHDYTLPTRREPVSGGDGNGRGMDTTGSSDGSDIYDENDEL